MVSLVEQRLRQRKSLRLPTRTITGGALACEALLAAGVTTLFGYPGGAALPFYRELGALPAAAPRAGAPRAERRPRRRRLRARHRPASASAWRPAAPAPPTC